MDLDVLDKWDLVCVCLLRYDLKGFIFFFIIRLNNNISFYGVWWYVAHSCIYCPDPSLLSVKFTCLL